MDALADRKLSAKTKRRQWTLVALLVTAGVVNYLDRSTLAIANHNIAAEMHLSPGQMGFLLSAFAWSYSVAQLPAGLLTDRAGPHIVLSAAMAVWSVAQMLCGAIQTYGQFVIARIGLGLGESPMFTSGARAVVDWFPIRDRGAPLGLFNSASSLGPALAPPLLTAVMLAFGWRSMFMVMGGAGLVVALVWWLYYREPDAAGVPAEDIATIRAGETASAAKAGPAIWKAFFAVPTTWAMIGGQFGTVYVTWLYVAWLPDYLESVRHVSVAQTGLFAAIPQFAGFVGGVLGGFLSDWLAHRNMDPVLSRKIPAASPVSPSRVLLTAVAPLSPDVGRGARPHVGGDVLRLRVRVVQLGARGVADAAAFRRDGRIDPECRRLVRRGFGPARHRAWWCNTPTGSGRPLSSRPSPQLASAAQLF